MKNVCHLGGEGLAVASPIIADSEQFPQYPCSLWGLIEENRNTAIAAHTLVEKEGA